MINNKIKKIVAGTIMAILVFQLVGVLFFAPKKVQALEGPAFFARWTWEKLGKIYDNAREIVTGQAMSSALITLSTTFGNNLAKNLVAGGPGGKPLSLSKALSISRDRAIENAGAEFLSVLTYGTEGYCDNMPVGYENMTCYIDNDCIVKVKADKCSGFVGPPEADGTVKCPGKCVGGSEGLNFGGLNLCAPELPSKQESVVLYWAKYQNPDKPVCSWSSVKKNWTEFASKATSAELLNQYSLSFDLKEMELATLADTGTVMQADALAAGELLTSLYNSADDFKPQLGIISRNKNVQASSARNQQEILDKMPEAQRQAQANASALKSQTMLSAFGNAFLSSYLNEVTKKMKDILAGKNNDDDLPTTRSISKGSGVREAEEIFSELLTVRIKSGAEVDLAQEFAICPSDTRFAGTNNCVIDQGLASAIANKLTIGLALEKGYLHGDWYVAPTDSSDSASDYLKDYSLSNIKKLRNARIMPLGLEIAAALAQKNTNKVTLKEIVDNYNNTESEWYHLVDPNWVLDVPDARCAAQTYSAIPENNSSNRQESCTALEFCLAKDAKGACRDWGFCTKEKVNFEFGGTACPSYFASCRSYKRQSDSEEFNYLKDSLVNSSCGEDNYGCQWYSNTAARETVDTTEVMNWQDLDWGRVYLNHNTAKCDANEAGCSQFLRLRDISGYLLGHLGSDSPLQSAVDDAIGVGDSSFYYDNLKVEELYLKKAPDYLHCYDGGTPDVDCNNYAAGCKADEVGCNRYTPNNGDPWVPAVTAPADFCPSECNGYQSFYRTPLWWDVSVDSVWTAGFENLIPNTAKKCSAQAVGCEEYTNLDTVAAGGEGREYYSQARVCQKTTNSLCTPYYTWEGDDRVGYQLRSYNLIKATADSAGKSAPCNQLSGTGGDVSGRTCATVTDIRTPGCYRGTCSHDSAINCNTDAACGSDNVCIINNSDCYQFYDASGTVYYELKSKTITCNDNCSVYRKNNLNGCAGGSGSDCLTTILASEGKTCAASENGCREYRGNTAGNVREIFSDNFEDSSLGYWGRSTFEGHEGNLPEISSASLYVGGYSLNVKHNPGVGGAVMSAVAERDIYGEIADNKSYTLTFLARADRVSSNLRIQFKGHDATGEVFAVAQPFGTEWQQFTVGPVYTSDWGSEVSALQFINNTGDLNNSDFFIDNVVLKEIQSSQYLIKDSWTTPASCNTNFGILSDTTDDVFSEGFMVGCQGYKNNDGVQVYLKSFTSLCSSDKAGCKALVDTQNSYITTAKTFNNHGYCSLNTNQTCNIDADCGDGQTCSSDNLKDNILIPADKIVYLVDDPLKRCSASNKGCSLLGQPVETDSGTRSYNNVTLINDPDLYSSDATDSKNKAILCHDKQLNCQKYTTSDGGSAYFVDPLGDTCDYLEGVSYSSGSGETRIVNGWFKTGVTPIEACGSGGDYTTTPNYAIAESGAGNCTKANDKCTAFVNPTAPSDENTVFYIKNRDLTENNCNGMVSRNSGCWLYSDQSQKDSTGAAINNSWNAALTYTASEAANNTPVSPVVGTEVSPNDANIILQQKIGGRDCGEWLACRSWEFQWDKNTSQNKKVCTLLGRCNKLASDNTSCAVDGWVDSSKTDGDCRTTSDCLSGSSDTQIKAGLACIDGKCVAENLTAKAYKNRLVAYNYFGAEYSGYSLYGIYPLDLLVERKNPVNNQYYLDNQIVCSTNDDCNNGFECIQFADGKYCASSKSCRGFAEADAPFRKETIYSGANKCENSSVAEASSIGDSCQCNYKKAVYNGENKYYNIGQDTPEGVCISGVQEMIGQECRLASDCCGTNGYNTENSQCNGNQEAPSCSYKTREDLFYGWPGVCLEPDTSRPGTGACITWYPTDRLPSDRDIYNNYTEAGYMASAGKQWYCAGDYNETDPDASLSTGYPSYSENRTGDASFEYKYYYSTKSYIEDGSLDLNNFPNLGTIYSGQIYKITVSVNIMDSGGSAPIIANKEIAFSEEPQRWNACFSSNGDYSPHRVGLSSIIPGSFLTVPDNCSGNLNSEGLWSYTTGRLFESGSATFRGKLEFDNIGALKKLKIYYYDHSGARMIINNIKIYLKKCPTIVKVSAPNDPMAIAWTDRLWSKNIVYDKNGGKAECQAYGAIGSDEISKPVLVNRLSLNKIGSSEDICIKGSTSVQLKNGIEHTVSLDSSFPMRIGNLFAKTFESRTLNTRVASDPTTWLYNSSAADSGEDFTRDGSLSFNQPQIVAIDGTTYENFNINGQKSGEVIITNRLAKAQFYAFVDENHMPLRGVEVDWGDGTRSGSMNFIAKNHKNKCTKSCTVTDGNGNWYPEMRGSCTSDDECTAVGISGKSTCMAASFGDTPEACEEKYWEFNHVYTKAGSYTPKVRVKDNWNWYTTRVWGGWRDDFDGGWIYFGGGTTGSPVRGSSVTVR